MFNLKENYLVEHFWGVLMDNIVCVHAYKPKHL